MNAVRSLANLLHYLSRILSIIILLVTIYATVIVVLFQIHPSATLPFRVFDNGSFQLFFPFTKQPFLLGDYTTSYLVSNLMIIAFYGLFLWLLADVFHSFKQPRLFTHSGINRLSRFYVTNLIVPFIFLILLVIFGNELMDIVRITLLHLVIGVFAYFMAAIFKQGVLLQEEQDLTL